MDDASYIGFTLDEFIGDYLFACRLLAVSDPRDYREAEMQRQICQRRLLDAISQAEAILSEARDE